MHNIFDGTKWKKGTYAAADLSIYSLSCGKIRGEEESAVTLGPKYKSLGV
jgi:hypothetical protein